LYIQIVEGQTYLCGLEALKENELTKAELELVSKEILLISQQGEEFSV